MATQVAGVSVNPEAKGHDTFDVTASAGLFVGVSNFEDSRIATVPFAADDAVDLAHLFIIELGLILPERTVLLLSGEPRKPDSIERLAELIGRGVRRQTARMRDVYQYLGEQARNTRQHGLFVLTLATHGVSDQGGDFLVAMDSLRERTLRTGVAVAELFDEVSHAGAGRRLVLLDACRERLSEGMRGEVNSAMTRRFAQAINRAKGSAVLSAAPLGGFAYDDPVRKNGVFTAAVLDGLRGRAGASPDGWITVRTLADFVQERVAEWVRVNRPGHAKTPSGIERRIEATAGDLPLAPHSSECAPEAVTPELSPRWWARRWARMMLLIAILVTMGGSLWMTLDGRAPIVSSERTPIFSADTLRRSKVPLPRPSVAVMTFENRSGKRDLDWLSTALAEAVSAKLGIAGDIRAVDRHEVALAETDLLLVPHAEPSPWDLERIRGLLGVEFVLRGVYAQDSGNSLIRLNLTLYDARNGRIVAQTWREGGAANWLDLAAGSIVDLPGFSLRQKLKWPPPTTDESLRALFPVDRTAAELYVQGLERYRHFDLLGAFDFYRKSAEIEPHPLVLAALADTEDFLGHSEEAKGAIQRAQRGEKQVRNTPRALPERYQREIELIERKIASGPNGFADKAQSLFREYFADDLSYGLVAAQAMVDAGSIDSAELFLKELRLLPLAEDHPSVVLIEAGALFFQKRYEPARDFARRAIAKAKALEAVRQEALARLQLASILSHMGDRAKAEEEFRKARAGFQRTGDSRGVAQCLEHTALFYGGFNLSQAEDLYRQAIDRYDDLGAQREKRRALLGLNAVLIHAGKLSEAERVSQEVGALPPPLDDGTEPLQVSARLYLAGDVTGAQRQLLAAKALLDKDEESENYATLLTNLGEIELMQGRLTNAEGLHIQALNIHEGSDSEVIPFDQICLGRVYMLAGDYPAARTRLDQALRWLDDADERRDIQGKGAAPPDPMTWTEVLLAMAELELLTSHAEQSEARVRELLGRTVREFKPVRSRALSLRARRLLGEGEIQGAWEAVNKAVQLASGDFRAVREAAIAAAQVRSARGEVELALKELDRIAAESAKSGQVVYELESILAAGEIELKRLGRSRQRLEDLRVRAAALGFGQIVQRVDSILKK